MGLSVRTTDCSYMDTGKARCRVVVVRIVDVDVCVCGGIVFTVAVVVLLTVDSDKYGSSRNSTEGETRYLRVLNYRCASLL